MASKNIKLAQYSPDDGDDIENTPEFEDRLQERMQEEAPAESPEEEGPGEAKPPFNPDAPHTVLKSTKPAFDPSKPSTPVEEHVEHPVGYKKVPEHTPQHPADTIALHLLNGALTGFGAPAAGIGNAIIDKASGNQGDFWDRYKYWRDAANKQMAEGAQDNPGDAAVGSFVGAIGNPLNEVFAPVAAAANAGKIAKAVNAGKNVAKVGTMGAAYGLGDSRKELLPGEYQDVPGAIDDMETGAYNGILTHGIMSTAGKLSRGVSQEELQNFANRRAIKAGGADKSLEKEIIAKGRVGDYGRALLTPLEEGGEKVVQAGDKVEDILPRVKAQRSAIKEKMNVVAKAIDDATPQSVSGPDIAKNIRAHAGKYPRTDEMAPILDDLENSAKYYDKKGDMSFADAQAHKNTYKYNRNADPARIDATNAKKMAVSGEMDATANQFSEDPNLGQDAKDKVALYADLKNRYGVMKNMEKAGIAKSAANQVNRTGSLTDHMMGLGVAAPAIGAAAMGHPAALAGLPVAVATSMANKAMRTRGSSTMAATANKVANMLQKSPQSLGKFRSILENALRQGPTSLALTHQLLMKDPEYMQTVGQPDESPFGQ